ncbi:hypothetical protein P692DRAFT_20829534 [Suillus brevipes Sb2]|nr:hypothetical protein P692DRAFT_20829534 [Suillus brevipes Sb2]
MGKGRQYWHRAYYVCSVPILLSEGECSTSLFAPKNVFRSGPSGQGGGDVGEFSSFDMLTGMTGTSAFGVAWECQWSLFRLRNVD